MTIHASAENYLETIHALSLNKNNVRSIDIANKLGFCKPSVSKALKNLRGDGYVEVDDDGYISLTSKGQAVAQSMYERHVFMSDWLIFLGVDKKTAVNDACGMEHYMSDESFAAIKKHVEQWKRNIYGTCGSRVTNF
jgi:Mn-dependent DtxR family transcriptional regulator